MIIQLFSDIHLEFYHRGNRTDKHVVVHPDTDVVVMPGDVDVGIGAFEYCCYLADTYHKPVVYVPGNHEYYQNDYRKLTDEFLAATHPLVHILINKQVVIDNVRFVGGTLWTDFALYENSNRMPTVKEAIDSGDARLNDFRMIRNGKDRFAAITSKQEHEVTKMFIDKVLNTPFDGKTVVVTHHAPHPKSINEKYAASERILNSYHKLPGEDMSWKANPCFASNLEPLLAKANIWLHGHVHDSFEYTVRNCRVYANPRGYPVLDMNGEPRYENRLYNPCFQIDL